jgi:hypothetical protein
MAFGQLYNDLNDAGLSVLPAQSSTQVDRECPVTRPNGGSASGRSAALIRKQAFLETERSN